MAHEYPDSFDTQPSRFDPERLLEIWHRRKWLALLVSAAVLGCAVGMALGLPDLYRASAKVLIDHCATARWIWRRCAYSNVW